MTVESDVGPIRFILMSEESYLQMRHLDISLKDSVAASSGLTSETIWRHPRSARSASSTEPTSGARSTFEPAETTGRI